MSDGRRAIAPAASAVYQRARTSKRHRPGHAAIGAAQDAAVHPNTEQTRGAAVQTVTGLAGASPKDVQRDNFKARLKQAIIDATPPPKTKAQADKVMKEGGAKASESLRTGLRAERDAAVGPMEAAAKTEAPISGQPAPPATELHVQPSGPPPALVSPDPVVPAPLPAERLDYSADRNPTDQAMAQADVTQDQLKKGNDPAFTPTLDSRAKAEKHEAAAEAQYRRQERAVQGAGHDEAVAALAHGLGGIHAVRAGRFGKVGGKQQDLKDRDKRERQAVTDRIAGIKNETKGQVDGILKQIDEEAPKIFGSGLARAEKAYDAAFKEAKGGIGTWLTTWGSRWERHIESALATARAEYMRQVDFAIDEVADFVDSKLHEAKKCVADGLKRVDDFVRGLKKNLKHAGEAARAAVSGDFDAMTAQIDEHRDALIGKLAQQYKGSYERMSAREEELREANKSLWQRVYDATVGLVKKIIEFKNMLLGALSRAAGVISDIIHHPIRFLGNLVDAVGLGLKNFKSNIAMHLKRGLMEWIFGALSGAGLQLPETFDLKGILSIVLQVLGLTYANFRARAVAIVGETVVNALERAAGVFKIFMTQGVAGMWEFIKEKVSDLKSMVLDAIFDYIKEKVITAGITWIIGLLNPVSAFFKACKAIYDIVVFFVNHASEIMELVNAIINSVSAIVKGNITAAANWVENALAKIIPLAIGFLASLLGLGDPSKPVKETIEKARSPVNKAIDWVIHGAAKKVGKLVAQAGVPQDPNERLRLGKTAALTALNRYAGRRLAQSVLAPLLAVIKVRYGFSQLEAAPVAGRWYIVGVINPAFREATESLTPESMAPGSGERTLLVGEGNFSFGLSIAAKVSIGGRLFSTDFVAAERKSLKSSPREAKKEAERTRVIDENIRILEAMGVVVSRQVDAADPASYPNEMFDIIVFNHPFTVTRDDAGKTVRFGEKANIVLIEGFLRAAKQKIRESGQIILISSLARLQRWKLDEIAARLDLDQSVRKFLASDFPGYRHEKTLSAESAATVTTSEQFAVIFTIRTERRSGQ